MLLARVDYRRPNRYSKAMELYNTVKLIPETELKRAAEFLYVQLPSRFHIFLFRSLFNNQEYKSRINLVKTMCWQQLDKWGIPHDQGLAYIRRRVLDAEYEISREMVGNFQLLEVKLMFSKHQHLLSTPEFAILTKHVKELYEKAQHV